MSDTSDEYDADKRVRDSFARQSIMTTIGASVASVRKGEVENVTWGTGQLGEQTSAADYVRATQTAHRLGRQMAAFHQQYDLLLTPGLGTGIVEALSRQLGATVQVTDHAPGTKVSIVHVA